MNAPEPRPPLRPSAVGGRPLPRGSGPARRRRQLPSLVAGLAVLLTAAAWVVQEPTAPPVPLADDAERPAAVAPQGPRAPAEPRPAAPVPPVRLAFAGDVFAEGPSGDAVRAGLPSIREVLGDADVTVANLETAITERGTPVPKQFVFRAPAGTLSSLREAGVDVVTMANNHGLDYGPVGVTDALEAEQASGLPVVGLGEDEDGAYAPHVVEVRGQRIAVLGATQVLDSSMAEAWTAGPDSPGMASAVRVERLLEEVRAAREAADTVVVYLHWGQERNPCPLPRQQELARALADAGADVVVGTHAHVLLGGGLLGGTYVDYGLGNFVFGARTDEAARTGVLVLTVSGREVIASDWRPAVLRAGAPHPLDGEAAEQARADKERRRECTGLTAPPGPARP